MAEANARKRTDLPDPADPGSCKAYFNKRRQSGKREGFKNLEGDLATATYYALGTASAEDRADMQLALRHARRRAQKNKKKS